MNSKVALRGAWFGLRLLLIPLAALLLCSKMAPLWAGWLQIAGSAVGLGSGCLLVLLVVLVFPALLASRLRGRVKRVAPLSWISLCNLCLVCLLLKTGSNLTSHGSWIFLQLLGPQHPLVGACQHWLGWQAGRPRSEPSAAPTPTQAPEAIATSSTPVSLPTPSESPGIALADPTPGPESVPIESTGAPLELKGGLVLVPGRGPAEPRPVHTATPTVVAPTTAGPRRAGFVTAGEHQLRNGFAASADSVELLCKLDSLPSGAPARLEVRWFNEDKGFTRTQETTTSKNDFSFKLTRPAEGWFTDSIYGAELKVDGRSQGVRRFLFPSPSRDQAVYAFLQTIRRGDLAGVKNALRSDPSLVNSLGVASSAGLSLADAQALGDYTTPLNLAISTDHGDIARALLQAGADPKQPSGTLSLPPLVLAARHSDSDLVAALLTAGASPQATEGLQLRSALHEAAEAGKPGNVRKLLKAGADPKAVFRLDANGTGWSPADSAVVVKSGELSEAAHLECLKLLLDAGCEPPPLARVCQDWGSTLILKELIARGVPLEAGRTNGDKALWTAVYLGRADQVELLCRAGADRSILVEGKPLTHWARQSEREGDKKLAILEQKP
ncbi:MAG: hypothetical protein U0931_01115 [Vulcanimicrobiota bacterium]